MCSVVPGFKVECAKCIIDSADVLGGEVLGLQDVQVQLDLWPGAVGSNIKQL